MAEEARHRDRFDAGAVGEFACRTRGRAHADESAIGRLEHLADGAHRIRLPGSGSADNDLDAEPLGAETKNRVGLVGTERSASTDERARNQARVERQACVRARCEGAEEVGFEGEESACRPVLFPTRRAYVGVRDRYKFGVGEHGVGETFEQRWIVALGELLGNRVL